MNDMKTDCCTSPSAGRDVARKEKSFDLAVVGAGSAGFSAAITAAELGARVALIGHGTIGGTCVNIGCVPSKTMIRAAETLHQARAAKRFPGIEARAQLGDWSKLMAAKDALVSELRQAKYIDLLPAYPSITYIEGKARLVAGGVLVDDVSVKAPKIIVTTGSHAAIPPIAGIDAVPYLTSTEALALDALPASLLVIGGGVIGVELGQMFARMGVRVTIVCRSRLLPGAEPEVSAALEAAFAAEGIGVVKGIEYRTIRHDGGVHLEVGAQDGVRVLEADKVLVATGRRANTKGLGLEDLQIMLTERGGIAVDEYMRTTRPGVYAAGDVTGRHMFVYMAAYGAKIAALNALEGDRHAYDATAMPEVVFTDPQVAMVGMTEDAARRAGHVVEARTLGLEHVPRALAARDTRGLIKLVAERESRRLLGAHIIAPEGADSIQTAALAIKVGLKVDALGAMLFPYLTTVEGLKLAAQTFEKDVAKLSCCAG